MGKRKILILLFFIVIVSSFFISFFYKDFKKIEKTVYINKMLSQESYSYLPIEAKEYIKEIYQETGDTILTEKNKEVNKPYLNPQFIEYLSFSEEEKNKIGDVPVSMIIDYSSREIAESINVPSRYDLRNDNGKNFVTPVRNQGNLGICWAFATAGAMESHLLKKSNSSYSTSSRLISERQLDYATSRNGIIDYRNEYVSFFDRSLSDGGNFYISTIALANGISLVDYNSFKEYDDHDLTRMELSDVLSYNKSLYEVNSTINFPRLSLRESTSVLTNEEIETRDNYLKEVKQNIINNGAAYVGTYMSSACQYTDSNLNNTVIDVYNCDISGGHAMEIIGWDDNLAYSYCADTKSHKSNISNCKRVISGKGVWILKNSWGNTLQYPYLTYDSLYSSISFITDVSTNMEKNWDNNYILGEGVENTKTYTFTLADTKIKNDETIKKIKFITQNPDTVYNVKIKKKDGTYKTFSKTSDLPGLITFDITDNILVNSNTEIKIYSDNSFIDKISVFTSNVNLTPSIDLSEYENTVVVDKIRLYSNTKNIPSSSIVTYKLYNSNGQDISNKVNFTNNIVAENNINTLATFSSDLDTGTYRIDAIYNSNIISSVNVRITKMNGLGTIDNPYKITNSTQLYQIRNDLDAYYELENDIDLSVDTREGGKLSLASEFCPQGFGWEAINGFSGSLNGNGHTIKGLYQNNFLTCNEDKETRYEWNNNGNGLFGTMKNNAKISNLILEDFDITCQGGYCGALVSKYIGNMNSNGNQDFSDTTAYTVTFQNIAIKNSKIKGVYNRYNSDDLKNSYGGGLLGNINSFYGNINISNIYIDIDINADNLLNIGYLANNLSSKNYNIENIRLQGDFQADKQIDILSNDLNGTANIRNIVSTFKSKNLMTSFLGTYYGSSMVIDGINMLNINDTPLCKNNTCNNLANVRVFNPNNEIVELTKQANYANWTGFNDNWIIKTIDGIPRIPTLKFMNFEYTSIPDITLNQELNKKVNIHDYIYPNIDAAKRINFKSNNENIVKLSDDGRIIPQATGSTTIHVESFYDGYIKNVPIQVTYVPHYTIIFDSNGGTGEMENAEVKAGNNYVLKANEFEKEYYEFNGWNTKADGSGVAYSDLGIVSAMSDKKTLTLYAQWIGEERIVTFDANGGTVNPDRKIVRYGDKYGELPIPTRSGYGFFGWATSDDFSIDADDNIIGYKLRASWQNDSYTLIYDANGGTIKNDYRNLKLMSDSIVIFDMFNNSTVTFLDVIYERDGYVFKEWNTKADGTGTRYSINQESIITPSNDSTFRLYAIWEKNAGKITFNSNYNNQTKIQSFVYNSDVNLENNTFTREGYRFKSWNTLANGNGISFSDGQIINRNNDLLLYAIWEINKYTVTFNSNGGSNVSSQTINYNGKVTKPTNPTKTGHTFKEWQLNGNPYDFNAGVTSNITLTAVWNINQYTVTFNSDGGSSVSSQKINYNGKAIKPANPTKEGYTFKEWQLNGNTYNFNTLITSNITLKAVWNKNEVIVNDTLKDILEKDGHVVEDGYTTKFTLGESISSIKSKLGNDVLIDSKTTIISTGTIIKRNNESYTVVIKGDLNGDGKVNSGDLLQMRKYLLEEVNLTGAYKKAGIIESVGNIKSLDLLRLRQFLLGEYNFK